MIFKGCLDRVDFWGGGVRMEVERNNRDYMATKNKILSNRKNNE